jgi:hypothetical protein
MRIDRIDNIFGISGDRFPAADYDFAESYAGRKKILAANEERETKEDALRKVEEAREGNHQTTLRMMDRHSEIVQKSQEFHKAKARRQAIERRNEKHREEQREILAEMALQNAQRRDFLEAARLKG